MVAELIATGLTDAAAFEGFADFTGFTVFVVFAGFAVVFLDIFPALEAVEETFTETLAVDTDFGRSVALMAILLVANTGAVAALLPVAAENIKIITNSRMRIITMR